MVLSQAKLNFIAVRDALRNETDFHHAYRAAYYKPLKFYIDHSTEESIRILIAETNNLTGPQGSR